MAGVIFCLVGILTLLFVGKDFLVGVIRGNDKQQSTNVVEEPAMDVYQPASTAMVIASSIDNSPNTIDITNNQELPAVKQNVNIDSSLNVIFGKAGVSQLRPIPNQYTVKNEYIHPNVLSPLLTLIKRAEAEGIRLNVVSAYRSYEHQKSIWERKWGNSSDNDINKASSILRYSSFPGTSRHHWGTEVDLNSVSIDYWQTIEGRKTYNWLKTNAPSLGFCQVYSPNRSYGYAEESWHWSHIPTASQYYSSISQPSVLSAALAQNIRGNLAVQQMPDQMMQYITGISSCSGTSRASTSVNPLSGTVSQKNSTNIKASPEYQEDNHLTNRIYIDDESAKKTSREKNPKPALGDSDNFDLPPASNNRIVIISNPPKSDSKSNIHIEDLREAANQ